MSAFVVERIPEKNTIEHKDLLALAKFEDRRARAVSFYFSSPSFSDKAHLQQMIAIKQLGRSILGAHFEQYPRSNGLLADLDAVLENAEGAQRESLGFKAIFACREEGIWQEFNLPARTDVQFLQSGKRFYLAPLLRAMESCRPYCVVLLEHGKARGFVARGTSIKEIPGSLPKQKPHVEADDSRTGWSHHIEGDQQQHAQAYLRQLSQAIQNLLAAEGCQDLVVGCREDLWSEIGPYLANRAIASLRGQFHLQSFDALPAEVLRAAQPVFEVYRKKCHAKLLGAIYESSGRGAEGISAVLQELEEGRVHTLLLGPASEHAILECMHCRHAIADGIHCCPLCNSTELETVNAQEALVRKALLTGAEIVPIDGLDASVTGNAAALLRY